jgi:hypothetical protein
MNNDGHGPHAFGSAPEGAETNQLDPVFELIFKGIAPKVFEKTEFTLDELINYWGAQKATPIGQATLDKLEHLKWMEEFHATLDKLEHLKWMEEFHATLDKLEHLKWMEEFHATR